MDEIIATIAVVFGVIFWISVIGGIIAAGVEALRS